MSHVLRIDSSAALKRAAVVPAFAVAFIIVLLRGRAPEFLYDARFYWDGVGALLAGEDFYTAGLLSFRGALSLAPYLPARFLADVTGTDGGFFVLSQNALLISTIGVILIPSILSHFVEVNRAHIWTSAVSISLLLSGFAPFPLMDLWAAALAFGGVAMLLRTGGWWALGAGLAFGAAANLRPAYFLPEALAFATWMLFEWRRAYWPILGIAIASLPQVLLNARYAGGSLSAVPVYVGTITSIQTQYSSYLVRYDTVAYVGERLPSQSFCNPIAAQSVVGRPTTNLVELAENLLDTFPHSLLFLGQKIGAALLWSPQTPYSAGSSAGFDPTALVVVLVASAGLLSLVRHLVGKKRRSAVILFALWCGSLLSLAGSTPETRFALPLVLVGIIGCLITVQSKVRLSAQTMKWGFATLILTTVLLILGVTGLAYPAAPAPGAVDVAVCASLSG